MATAPDDPQSRPPPVDNRPDGGDKIQALPVNGAYSPGTNHAPQPAHAPPPVKPVQTQTLKPPSSALAQLPPEIQHITQGYQPLSKLFQRTVQLCFNSLTELINSLADLPDGPQQNGNLSPIHHSQGDGTSRENLHKKSQWLHFANSQRERFIKLLVLLQWSRRIDDISRAIDVGFFLSQRSQDFEDARIAMGEIKREMESLRLPAPDIEGALEALTTGKSSRMPDLGYILPQTLSPQRIRDIFRDIDISLHVRINLHENLPPFFSDYHIHSGRVTFVVPSEFEVDLFADQDPASPWYFIDLRFVFPNASEIPFTQFWSQLEGFVNYALATKGLLGCYEFLHDFVLTHMINILRKKALRLARQSWSGSLRIDQMHRSLVLQYWKDRLPGKHWIEIGVKRVNAHGSHEARTSAIGIKWCRSGKEVADVSSLLDLATLDIEAILTTITHRHSVLLLSDIRDKWLAAQPHSKTASIRLNESPGAVALDFSSAERSWSVAIEPVGGEFRLLPPSRMAERFERRLNEAKRPKLEPAVEIKAWETSVTRDLIEQKARNFGWTLWHLQLDLTSLRAFLGDDAQQYSLFKHTSWSDNLAWFLLCAIDASGEQSWVIIRTAQTHDRLRIEYLDSLEFMPDHNAFATRDTAFLVSARVNRVAFVSFLREQAIEFKLEYPRPNREAFRMKLVLPSDVGPPQTRRRPQLQTIANLELTCSWSEDYSVLKSLSLQLSGRVKSKSAVLDAMFVLKSGSLEVWPSGEFRITATAPIGSTTALEETLARLQSIIVLGKFASALKLEGLPYKVESASRITFWYGPDTGEHRLKARVELPARTGNAASLAIAPARSNPHSQLLRWLTAMLNQRKTRQGIYLDHADMQRLIRTLNNTLAPLEALQTIKERARANVNLRCLTSIHILDGYSYNVVYPQYLTAFDITYISRQDDYCWAIWHRKLPVTDSRVQVDVDVRDKLQQALEKPLREQAGNWFGCKTGILATADAVKDVICQLDEIVRSHAPVVSKLIWDADAEALAAAQKNASVGQSGSARGALEPASASASASASSLIQSQSQSQTQSHTQTSANTSMDSQTQSYSQTSTEIALTATATLAPTSQSQQSSVNGPTGVSKTAPSVSATAKNVNGLNANVSGPSDKQQHNNANKGGTSASAANAHRNSGVGGGGMSNGNPSAVANANHVAGTSSVDAIEID